ncbi:Type II secretory pathway, pseudopilin PulG [Duganella sacchari]|uniref:Type II secretory pathway, pseudopilin PulG n=1 Tax=Duganella sacchari TaxID=551987 RepID=A0A1M7QA90_9BURK|nr:type II secretion system protein [Duganella sacchari]SHN27269.1 Type II secretory pathway, pseudopilin PulG [Duganella sacchari]
MARPSTSSEQRGFAYLWTLMLIAFMGVGLTIAADLYATATRRDKERELIFIGHEFRVALERYYTAPGQPNEYPLTLEELLKDPRFPGARRYLRRLYNDPVTGKPDWVLVRQQGRIVGLRSLSTQRPIKQGNFDDDDVGLANKTRYADWVFTYPYDLFTPVPGEGVKH